MKYEQQERQDLLQVIYILVLKAIRWYRIGIIRQGNQHQFNPLTTREGMTTSLLFKV